MVRMSTSDALPAFDAAQDRLARAWTEVRRLQHRGAVLARATDWHSPAAEAYRRALAEWTARIGALERGVDALADQVRAERARLTALRGSQAARP